MMHLNSLVIKTDLIFARFSGEVIDRGNYLVIRTPSNTGYHLGNYLEDVVYRLGSANWSCHRTESVYGNYAPPTPKGLWFS